MSSEENTTPEPEHTDPTAQDGPPESFADFIGSLDRMPKELREALVKLSEDMSQDGVPTLFSTNLVGNPPEDGEDTEVMAMRVSVDYVVPERTHLRPIMVGVNRMVIVEAGDAEEIDGHEFPTMNVTVSATDKRQAIMALMSALEAVKAFPENHVCGHDHS